MSIGFIKAYALPARSAATAQLAAAAEPAAAALSRSADSLRGSFGAMLSQLDAGASPAAGAKLVNGLEGRIAVSQALHPGLPELKRALAAAQSVGRSIDGTGPLVALPKHGTSLDAQLKHLRNAIAEVGHRADYRITPWSAAHRTG